MRKKDRPSHPLGGIIHTYQKYNPAKFPSPTKPPPDLVSPMFEHLLFYGSHRELTEEELANAIHIDPSQIEGLGPSLDALIEMLRQRKRKILETYETDTVQRDAARLYHQLGQSIEPPERFAGLFQRAYRDEQIHELERLWYAAEDDHAPFARDLLHLNERLGDKYQIDELAAKYEFIGRTPMTIEEALAIKEELEKIDQLLEQLREARQNAQIGIVDLDALQEFATPGDIEKLNELQQRIAEYLRQMAEMQGLERGAEGYQLTPKAYRIFQSKLLERIFSELKAARSGRHAGPVVGEGAVELPRTKPYEFGDSIANMDIPQSLMNAMIREAAENSPRLRGGLGEDETAPHTGRSASSLRSDAASQTQRIRLTSDDIEIHETRNSPKCATAVLLDMSGSMRYDGQYINAKRMGLALDGLIRSEYPGDFLRFIEVYTFARVVHISELANLMPKPVTVRNSLVRLKVDMSDENVIEMQIPPHFTNIQRGLQLGRQFLTAQDTPNRQMIVITDGLPTAHFEDEYLYLLYPPDPRTEDATMREARLCAREGITINVFLLPNWWQSEDDVQFAHRMAEKTGGRVFFTAGRDLDRFVVWDYVKRKRSIIS